MVSSRSSFYCEPLTASVLPVTKSVTIKHDTRTITNHIPMMLKLNTITITVTKYSLPDPTSTTKLSRTHNLHHRDTTLLLPSVIAIVPSSLPISPTPFWADHLSV